MRRLAWILLPLALSVAASSASASPLPADCVRASGLVVCTYTGTGSVQQLSIPAGATQISIVADGAPGGWTAHGNTSNRSSGGNGAEASAQFGASLAGQTLTVSVGQAGQPGGALVPGASAGQGGWPNGGQATGSSTAGGGGAPRRCPAPRRWWWPAVAGEPAIPRPWLWAAPGAPPVGLARPVAVRPMQAVEGEVELRRTRLRARTARLVWF
jgi:hypothetical protein